MPSAFYAVSLWFLRTSDGSLPVLNVFGRAPEWLERLQVRRGQRSPKRGMIHSPELNLGGPVKHVAQLMHLRAMILVLGISTIMASCSGDETVTTGPSEPNPQVAQVVVSPGSAELNAVGDTTHFEATALDERGNELSGVDFTWISSDEAVATVDSRGVATAESEGEVEISAEAQGVSGSAALSIELFDVSSVEGNISLPSGSVISEDELTVSSFVADAQVNPDDTDFRVEVMDVETARFLMAVNANGGPVLAAVVFPEENGTITMNSTATAKALVLTSPFFEGAERTDYERAYGELEGQPGFDQLVSRIDDLLRSDDAVDQGFFAAQTYGEISSMATGVARSVLGASARVEQGDPALVLESDDPVFLDGQDGVVAENPDVVFRGINLTNAVSSGEQGVLVPRATTDWRFGIPPVEVRRSDKAIGTVDGPYDVWVSTGFNLDDVGDAENAVPALLNLGELARHTIAVWGPGIPGLEEIPECYSKNLSAVSANRLSAAVNELVAVDGAADLADLAGSTAGQLLVDLAIECVATVAKRGGLGRTKFGNALFRGLGSVWDAWGKVGSATEFTLFVNDWLIEDAFRDPPFNGTLGGTYVQRYVLHGSGSGLAGVTRGAGAWFQWEPDVAATVTLDGSSAKSATPAQFLSLGQGRHSWKISNPDYRTTSGSFDVNSTGWTVVERDLEKPRIRIRIEPADPPELAINQTQQFEAVAVDSQGDRVSLPGTPEWSSSNPNVVEIDSRGVATAVDAGNAEIDVVVDGIEAESPVSLTIIDVEAQPSASTTESSLEVDSPSDGAANVCVSVSNVDGEPLQGLTASDFNIPDVDHAGGTLSFAAVSTSTGSAVGTGSFSAALLVDQSGSMSSSDPSDARLSAAKQFAQRMQVGDETALFTFGGSLTRETDFTSSDAEISAAVEGLGAPSRGSTAIYDSGAEACAFVASHAKQSNQAVVILTDGQDNASSRIPGDLIQECNSLGVKVFTVGFADALPGVLARIAAEANGTVIHDTEVDVILSGVRSLPDLLRGDAIPRCVNFDVEASGLDLTVGGEATGRVNVDLTGATTSSGNLVASFVGATTSTANTVSAPFYVRWSETGSNGRIVYEEDFSSDPGYEVIDSYTPDTGEVFEWDATGEYYRVRIVEQDGGIDKYAEGPRFTEVDETRDFRWQADLRVAEESFGMPISVRTRTGLGFTTFGPSVGHTGTHSEFSITDGTGNRVRTGENTIRLNTWYRVTIDYDASAGTGQVIVTSRDGSTTLLDRRVEFVPNAFDQFLLGNRTANLDGTVAELHYDNLRVLVF